MSKRKTFDALRAHRKNAERLLSSLYSEEPEQSRRAAERFAQLPWVEPPKLETVLRLRAEGRIKHKHALDVAARDAGRTKWAELARTLRGASGSPVPAEEGEEAKRERLRVSRRMGIRIEGQDLFLEEGERECRVDLARPLLPGKGRERWRVPVLDERGLPSEREVTSAQAMRLEQAGLRHRGRLSRSLENWSGPEKEDEMEGEGFFIYLDGQGRLAMGCPPGSCDCGECPLLLDLALPITPPGIRHPLHWSVPIHSCYGGRSFTSTGREAVERLLALGMQVLLPEGSAPSEGEGGPTQAEGGAIAIPLFAAESEGVPEGAALFREGGAAFSRLLATLAQGLGLPPQGELRLPLSRGDLDSYCGYLWLHDDFSERWDPEEREEDWKAEIERLPWKRLLNHPENAPQVLSEGVPPQWEQARVVVRSGGRLRLEAIEVRPHAGKRSLRSAWLRSKELMG